MKNYLDFLDKDKIALMENNLAKPNKSIKKHTDDLLIKLDNLSNFGYIDKNSELFNLVTSACIYHDIGKVNKYFQNRVNGETKKFDIDNEVGHNLLSLCFIDKSKFEKEEDYFKVCSAVLYHHNYCDNIEEMSNKNEIIKNFSIEFNLEKLKLSICNKISKVIESDDCIKIQGLLRKCDYSASSDRPIEYENDFLESSLKNLMITWKEKDNKSSWNDLQDFCVENNDKNIIAVAETGMGKTEAGLLWIGNNKGFFILPLRSAINAIYDRIRKNIINDINVEERLAILHSNSREYYLAIKNNNNNVESLENVDIIEYDKLGKQLAMPLNIATMDQVFDFVYKYTGYELKLTTLSHSKIVIDEIQAYSPDLLAYLICGIERIVELGGKVAILTATLPPYIKDLLNKNIDFKEADKSFTKDNIRHNLKVANYELNYEDIYEKYNSNKKLNKSNKILVVCNTIKKAQQVYRELSELIEEDEINILHSKFIKKDRLKKELQIIEFGKTFDENGNIDYKNGIWISTSIVEASLDIDFDYLFTELQDLNSLFQRMGRCNRKGMKDFKDYNCYLYTEIDEKTLINGKKGFIDKTLYEISKESISFHNGQISEIEKIEIINKNLTSENIKNSDYIKKYKEIYDYMKEIPIYEFKEEDIDLRNILSVDIIPGKVYEDNVELIKSIEKRLKDYELSIQEIIELREEINKFTVSVYPFDIKNYERAPYDKKEKYDSISLDNKGFYNIKVIDCEYSEVGYERKDFKNNTLEGVFL